MLPPPGLPRNGMLYLAVDGTGIPMTAAETASRAGKGPNGRARTREAKLAACFTQTKTDENGYPTRDPDSTSYVATLDPVETFADLVEAEARGRGSDHIRQLVVLGDGARWIWNLATTRFPKPHKSSTCFMPVNTCTPWPTYSPSSLVTVTPG